MKKVLFIIVLTVSLGGCASFVQKLQSFSNNYQTTVATINTDIAASAPLVATGCADIQKYAMLIVPFLPKSGKAPQYIAAANSAINAYCQNVPTDIAGTIAAVNASVNAAKSGYASVKSGA